MLPLNIHLSKVPIFLFLFLIHLNLHAQECTISGFITDESNGEALIGASIYTTSTKHGTTTNAYGFYSITIPASDSLGLVFSYLGYQAEIKKIYPNGNLELSVQLKVNANVLDEVIISSKIQAADRNITETQMSVINIPIDKINELPMILGEADVLKVIPVITWGTKWE